MVTLESTTLTISKDEKCLWLAEIDRPTPPLSRQHRWQIIVVMRGEHPSTYEWDMGPREMYQRQALLIPLGIVHGKDGERYASDGRMAPHLIHRYEPLYRVGEAMDIADWKRSELLREDLVLPDKDWAQSYVDQAEEAASWKMYRSTFGPLGSIVRN